jgi:hypothetical protein
MVLPLLESPPRQEPTAITTTTTTAATTMPTGSGYVQTNISINIGIEHLLGGYPDEAQPPALPVVHGDNYPTARPSFW